MNPRNCRERKASLSSLLRTVVVVPTLDILRFFGGRADQSVAPFMLPLSISLAFLSRPRGIGGKKDKSHHVTHSFRLVVVSCTAENAVSVSDASVLSHAVFSHAVFSHADMEIRGERPAPSN